MYTQKNAYIPSNRKVYIPFQRVFRSKSIANPLSQGFRIKPRLVKSKNKLGSQESYDLKDSVSCDGVTTCSHVTVSKHQNHFKNKQQDEQVSPTFASLFLAFLRLPTLTPMSQDKVDQMSWAMVT